MLNHLTTASVRAPVPIKDAQLFCPSIVEQVAMGR